MQIQLMKSKIQQKPKRFLSETFAPVIFVADVYNTFSVTASIINVNKRCDANWFITFNFLNYVASMPFCPFDFKSYLLFNHNYSRVLAFPHTLYHLFLLFGLNFSSPLPPKAYIRNLPPLAECDGQSFPHQKCLFL